jgi:hypothetical protein
VQVPLLVLAGRAQTTGGEFVPQAVKAKDTATDFGWSKDMSTFLKAYETKFPCLGVT